MTPDHMAKTLGARKNPGINVAILQRLIVIFISRGRSFYTTSCWGLHEQPLSESAKQPASSPADLLGQYSKSVLLLYILDLIASSVQQTVNQNIHVVICSVQQFIFCTCIYIMNRFYKYFLSTDKRKLEEVDMSPGGNMVSTGFILFYWTVSHVLLLQCQSGSSQTVIRIGP